MRYLAVLSALLLSACIHRASSHSPAYRPTQRIALTVLNFGRRPIRFEFRVDGVQMVDTTVRVGGLPPLVFERDFRLTTGKHRLELYDPRTREFHTQDFEVRPSDMTVEIRLLDDHSELRTYYSLVGYM